VRCGRDLGIPWKVWREKPKLARAFCKVEGSEDFLRLLRRKLVETDIYHHSAAVQATGRQRKWQKAVDLLRSIPEVALHPSPVSYSNGLNASSELWALALCLFRSMRGRLVEADAFIYGAASNACEKCGAWQTALDFTSQMSEQEVLPNVVTSSSALCACREGHQWLLAVELLGDLRLRGIELDVVARGSVVGACKAAWEQAFFLHHEPLGDARLARNIISYSALLQSCSECSEWSQSLHILRSLKTTASRPDTVALTSVISAFEAEGRWKQAFQVSCGIAEAGLQRDLLSLAATCASIPAHWAKALTLHSDGHLEDPDQALLFSVLNVCKRTGQWQVALGFWAKAPRTKALALTNLVIGACGALGAWHVACCFLNWMLDEDKHSLDIVTCTSILSVCEVRGRWQQVLWTLGLMPKVRVVANQISWNAAISSAEKSSRWALAIEFLTRMLCERVAPDCISCSSTISACQKSSAWARAIDILFSMHGLSEEPDSICWSSVLLACAEGAAWTAALDLLDSMQDVRVHDLLSLCNGATACLRVHQHPSVARLLATTSQICHRQLFDTRLVGL
ncbi:EMB2654, partial [Symbiodinium sp. KB8]